MKKKNWKATLIVLVVIVALYLLYHFWIMPERRIYSNCDKEAMNHIVVKSAVVACYGVITVSDSWDLGYLSVRDILHDYELAQIGSLDQIHMVEQKLYLKNTQISYYTASEGDKKTYYKDFYRNGKLVKDSFSKAEDVPSYIVVDYKTGEVSVYKTLDELPQAQRGYFQ